MTHLLNRDWRDPAWSTVGAVQAGLTNDISERCKVLFGKNEIDVEAKSIPALLIDEVRYSVFC